jgi:hypothetical protein
MGVGRLAAMVAAVALLAGTGEARAQNLMGIAQQNMMFDYQMNQQLMRLQQQNAAYGQQIWNSYLQQFGPQLRQEYQQYMAAGNPPVSFEQFAYWMLITANGTNVQGALQQQQQNFNGMQQAYRTQQQGFADYNAGWQRNSQATTNAIENYDRRAVQGLAPYADPNTGETRWLPYSQPAGQVYTSGGNSWVQDQAGTYYQWQGNSWVRMDPAQR